MIRTHPLPLRGAVLAGLASAALVSPTLAQETSPLAEMVEKAAEVVRDKYVDADLAEQAGARLEAQLAAGAYSGINEHEVARAMTDDLRAVTGDLHFRVTVDADEFRYLSEEGGGGYFDSADDRMRENKDTNFGFTELRLLDGNIGYLKLDRFAWGPGAVEKAQAAMTFLADTNAVVIDLSDNGGGHSQMETLLCSYFLEVDDENPLIEWHTRSTGSVDQTWILNWLPGKRMPDKPVVFITTESTFSAAEGLAYHLVVRGRAKVVGQRSSGGANAVTFQPLANDFILKVPYISSIDPASGGDWEGTGVAVDIECEPQQARDIAYLAALESALDVCDESQQADLAWFLDLKRSLLSPVEVDPAVLKTMAGDFEGVQVEFRDGQLWAQPPGAPSGMWLRLIPVSQNRFVLEGKNDMKITMIDEGGEITGAKVLLQNGREMFINRNP